MKRSETRQQQQRQDQADRHAAIMDSLHDIEQRLREIATALRELVKVQSGGTHVNN